MGKHGKKGITKIVVLIYVIFLLSIILINGLSRFRKTYTNENVSAKIATPIINVITGELEIKDLHNEEYEWNFCVNNYNGDKDTTTEINQITLEYKIEIDIENLPNLQYEMFSIENGEKSNEPIQLTDGKTGLIELKNREIQENNYCLVIKTTDNVDQKSLKENISINVSANQKV